MKVQGRFQGLPGHVAQEKRALAARATVLGIVLGGLIPAMAAWGADEVLRPLSDQGIALNQGVTLDADDSTSRAAISLPPHATRSMSRPAAVNDGARLLHSTEPFWKSSGLGALLVVLAVIGACYWLVRRWIPTARGVESAVMRVVARTNLTPKHHLILVAVGRRMVMIGIAGDRMSALCEMTDGEEMASLLTRTSSAAGQDAKVFDEFLAHEKKPYGGGEEDSAQSKADRSSHVPRASKPLSDLLHKVRAMQAKL